MKFMDKLTNSIAKHGHVCVGLDTDYDRIPEFIRAGKSVADAIIAFNRGVVDATKDCTAVYKINVSFYTARREDGVDALTRTVAAVRELAPDVPVLADTRRSDMGDAVKLGIREFFEGYGFDGMLVSPWFGRDTVKEYLAASDSYGICFYAHDSNPSAPDLQDLELKDGRKVYEELVRQAVTEWNVNGNMFIEGPATYPAQLKRIRELMGDDMVLLVAGIGPQGGKPESLTGLFGKDGKRLVANSSRAILYPANPVPDYFPSVRDAALKLKMALSAVAAG